MPADSPPVWVITTTFPERVVAATVSRQLVAEGIVACAQVGAGLASFYRWHGELQHSEEIAVAFKVRADRRDACVARLRALHPYQTPQVLGWPALLADADYVAWVFADDTQTPAPGEGA